MSIQQPIATERLCMQCGTSLAGMRYLSRRKYCSIECGNKANYKYVKKKPSERKKRLPNIELRTQVLELYWGGFGRRRIARYLNIPEGTVRNLIHLYGMERERLARNITNVVVPEMPGTLIRLLYKAADADEWLELFRKLTPPNSSDIDATPVYLACRTIRGNSGFNKLATIIIDELKREILNGERFAFCSKEHETVITIQWSGSMFNINVFPHPTPRGTFIWPNNNCGEIIKLDSHEFDFLISYKKYNKLQGVS